MPELSHGRRGFGNTLVHGENAAVLHLLSRPLAGTVKCVYIDPPYNNNERYRHYDDAQEHGEWLAGLEARLRLLSNLLTPDGSLWISIDDREVHYLKVAADRVMGRKNFVSTIVWQQRTTRENRKIFSNNHEYILVYAKDTKRLRGAWNALPPTRALLARYKNLDADPRGPWQSVSATVQDGHGTKSQFYTLVAPNGRRYVPPKGRCWAYSQQRMLLAIHANNVYFGKSGTGVPRLKLFRDLDNLGVTPETLWLARDVGTSDSAKKHVLSILRNRLPFDTPKPEELISRILFIATNPGDLVLDAYLGSGTTAAVAHKMGRKYIGIERGSHAVSVCAVRLREVIQGEQGGISGPIAWSGGGSVDFYRLLESTRRTSPAPATVTSMVPTPVSRARDTMISFHSRRSPVART